MSTLFEKFSGDFQQFILSRALKHVKATQLLLRDEGLAGEISWMQLPPESEMERDKLVEVYVELLKVSLEPDIDTLNENKLRLCQLLPASTPAGTRSS